MTTHSIIKNDHGFYEISGTIRPDDIINLAADILYANLSQQTALNGPAEVARFLQMKLANEAHENFGVIFLDSKHRVISYQKLFLGTIDSATVYPRVVAKIALSFNAAAVILAHNHPSNDCEPSEADKRLTLKLKESLALIDIRVLDHFIVSRSGWVSFAERSLL